MQGKDTLWIPGVDHAGIATQNVVEKKLAKEKKTRDDLGREKFLEEVWTWKNRHGDTITNQLRRLGASCDWSRERFTMDEGLSDAVRECFIRLFDKGLIYQGDYIINWCPRCQTALSDEESAHKETQGGLYHIKYPIAGMGDKAERIGEDHIVVATTRPETMLGDSGVAVHPEDPRYRHLIGKKVILPLIDREIPIVADDFVDPEFGTGMVKVTPAHDPNDFEMGNRHNLPRINVMHPNGTINKEGGPYEGQDRFKARKQVITDLEEKGLFIQRDSHLHSVGHCYRCDTVVEPYLSKQWFVKMKPLAEKAMKAHSEGKTKFYPDRWTKVYTNWLENTRDWCISRQIWWGHQIPVWYDADGNYFVAKNESEAKEQAKKKHGTDVDLKQDPDVLDTWFSSWLWPFSTLGWPKETEDLKHFYKTSDLITAAEIIYFWVARMIMAGLEFLDEEPFNRIYLHGTVRAQSGLKMSKSLGNSIDPLEVIDEMGADALRFSLVMLSAQDVYLSREKFEVGRNFTNKIWNASRFVMMNLEGFKKGSSINNFDLHKLPVFCRWILSRLQSATEKVNDQLSEFGLAQSSSELYHFVWNDYCDWFIELAKPALQSSDVDYKESVQKVLFFVLENILRLTQPYMPFITEEIWQKMKPLAENQADWAESIMIAGWPSNEKLKDEEPERLVGKLQRAVTGFRNIRANLNIPPSQKLEGVVNLRDEMDMEFFTAHLEAVERLAKVKLKVEMNFAKSNAYIGSVFPDFEVYARIEGIVDPATEVVRIEKIISESKKWMTTLQKKLSNKKFVENAPKEVIKKEKEKLSDVEKKLKAQEELLTLFK